MHRRTSRLNHVLLVVVGLVLLAGGAFLIARHYGWISQLPTSDRLYSRSQQRWIHDREWVFWIAGAVAIVIGLIALRWLLVQPRIDRLKRLHLDPDVNQAGHTALVADALTDRIEDDLDEHPGVVRSRALLLGTSDRPVVLLRISTQAAGDIDSLRRHIAERVLPDARTALEADTLPAQVHLLVAGKSEKRVVE